MKYAVFTYEDIEENGIVSTHKAACIGRFSYTHDKTIKDAGSKMSFRYYAMLLLSAIVRAEGNISDIGLEELSSIEIQKRHVDKICNEDISLADFEYMGA